MGYDEEPSSSEEEATPAVPPGALGRVGRELLRNARAGEDEYTHEAKGSTSIVDQSQFRNLAIGKGYKAPFVVRQPTASPATTVFTDERPTAQVYERAKKDKKKDKKRHKKGVKKHKKRRSRDDEEDRNVAQRTRDLPSAVPAKPGVESQQVSPSSVDHPQCTEWDLPRRLARLEELLEQRLAR